MPSGFVAPLNVGADGWVNPGESWTFASATTINVPNGALYQKGDYLKFTQSATVKYFAVVGISSNVLTLVSQDAGATTNVANAAITSNYFSRQQNPLGLPVFTWVPGFTGFSANPTSVVGKFWFTGGIVTVDFVAATPGTSNATTFTITGLPVSALAAQIEYALGALMDNSAISITQSAVGNLSGTTLSLFASPSATAWTASGTKNVYNWTISYTF